MPPVSLFCRSGDPAAQAPRELEEIGVIHQLHFDTPEALPGQSPRPLAGLDVVVQLY